ncbi:MAG: TIGR04076 family protein [Candidatus Bipolaricaulia bacterium]
MTICPEVEEGQVFIAESLDEMPSGFCAAAWTDIVSKIAPQLAEDSSVSQELRSNSEAARPLAEQPFYLSCMDGLRPVTFEVTLIAE